MEIIGEKIKFKARDEYLLAATYWDVLLTDTSKK